MAVASERLDKHIVSMTVVTSCNSRRALGSGYHAVCHQVDNALQWKMWNHITHINRETVFSVGSVLRQTSGETNRIPCGGGVKYFHRSPASCRRRRKGKSQIWECKIWLQVPWDSDLRMTALMRASSNCKWHMHPLVRDSTPHQETRNCLTVIKIWS
jgi:hypothetical protein